MWFTSLWNLDHEIVQWFVVVAAALLCAVTDFRSRRILNVVTVPVLVSGLLHAALVAGWAGVADAVTASFLLALPYLILYAFACGGAGDAKLMAATGAWLGVVNGLAALFVVAIVSVFFAPLYAYWSRPRLPAETVSEESRHVAEAARESIRTARIPFGLAICVGVCLAAQGILMWPD